MRRALATLAVTLPACLSGFTEIRVVRPDAGTVDAVRADIPAPADASQSPADALDAPSATDVLATPLDAPEVAVPVDVVTGPDVLDADAGGVDALDVPATDALDAGELADRTDVFDVQCPTPLCGGRCVDTSSDPANCGACGRACASRCVAGGCARLAGIVPVMPRDRFRFSVDPRAEWEMMCRAAFPGSRVCRMADVRGTPLHAEICTVVWPMREAGAVYGLAALAEMPRTANHDGGSTSYVCAECANMGAPIDGWGGCTVPYTVACCSP